MLVFLRKKNMSFRNILKSNGPGLYLRRYDESVPNMSTSVTLFSTVQPSYTGAGYISMAVNQDSTPVDSIYISYVNFPSPKIYFGRKDITLPLTDNFDTGQILISGDGADQNTPGFANSISAPINSGPTTNVFIAWIEGTTSSGAPYKVQFRKSTNNGDSWDSSSSIITIDNQNITSNKSVNIIAVTNTSLIVSYIKSSKVYVKTSNDGGNTWSSGIVASGNATVSEMSVMKRNEDKWNCPLNLMWFYFL